MDRGRYLELFVSESREHLDRGLAAIPELGEAGGGVAETLARLMRHAHSLKGMAATMGFASMVRLCHALEDLFERACGEGGELIAGRVRLLESCWVCLGRMIDDVEAGGSGEREEADRLAGRVQHFLASSPPPLAPSDERDRPDEQSAASAATAQSTDREMRRWRVEVRLGPSGPDTAARVLALSRELAQQARIEHASPGLSHSRSGSDDRLTLILAADCSRASLHALLTRSAVVQGFNVEPAAALPATTQRKRKGPRWSRVRADLLDDLMAQTLDLIVEHGRSVSRQEGQRTGFMLKRLYGTVAELRMLDFGSLGQRLRQSAATVASDLGKRITFEIEGAELRLDRAMLDTLADPLLHLVRNAVDHGIEGADARRRLGKPACGHLTLRVTRRGERVRITLGDDGGGLCPQRLRQAAVEGGFLSAEAAGALSDSEALKLITRAGFSTAPAVSEISGRGVGLDVVRQSVERLGGRLRIRSKVGAGTTIRLSLPANVAMVPSLLVRCSGELFGLPVAMLLRTLDLDESNDRAELELFRLDEMLGVDPAGLARPDGGSILLLAGEESDHVGLVVDQIVGRRDLLVRPLQPPLTRLAHYSGAALLDDGSIALMVDPSQMRFGVPTPAG